ncbi:MAG: hypothetical protein BWY76_00864 [bacterium ADurb.Bin429]|nr:MAG: hypothetical protein BWY76_00864 [bacterium ADurb.Bin429]
MERDPRLEAIKRQRRHPVHGVFEIPTQSTIAYLTVGTCDGRPWAANFEVQTLLHDIWTAATAWRVGHYLLMPDHLHYFATPGWHEYALERWAMYWKRLFTQGHGDRAHRWQIDHWDTRIRSAEHYHEKWEYVRQNPVKAGLVACPDDWPFQGTVFDVHWYQTR